MKTVLEHIEHVKGKPHHVRKRVAFGAAAVVTGLVALVWLGGSLATGAFAIRDNPLGTQPAVATENSDTNNSLAGAAAALPPSSGNVPAHIEIIDATASTSSQKQAEQTVIPF